MKQSRARTCFPSRPAGRTIRSDDGSIVFTIAGVREGVFVERMQVHGDHARVVHSAVFPDEASFRRWCDADPVKFAYPLVHIKLMRDGDALFDRRG